MFAEDDELALAETAAAKNGNILNDQVKNPKLIIFKLHFSCTRFYASEYHGS
jgi:hypothetical protein